MTPLQDMTERGRILVTTVLCMKLSIRPCYQSRAETDVCVT
jgi:hypothetical protein